MATSGGLRARLGRTLLLQAAFIGAAAVIGVFLSSVLLEGVLIRQALRDEAEFFWASRALDPAHPLPATLNLTGHIDDVPEPLADLGPGYHDWVDGLVESVVYVDDRGGQRLYLSFDRSGVARLATFFGLLPLAMVLLVLYVSTWLGFRASRRAFSPVIALARRVRELDPKTPDPAAFGPAQLPPDADDEVRELAAALSRYSQRLSDFIERERHFTRDASHELRSPLTVIQMAAGILLADPALGESAQRSVQRIRRAARDMEELIAAFLLLARESEAGLPLETVRVNDLIAEEIERARLLAEGRPVTSSIRAECRLHVDAPEKVLSVLVGNVLRNAFSYTDAGEVAVDIRPYGVLISDTGVGMAPGTVREMYEPFVRGDAGRRGGHGVGLTIVRRLSERFGWPVEISSQLGVGTRVEIRFPGALAAPLDPADGAPSPAP
jgi:signal transduction histidine kinase